MPQRPQTSYTNFQRALPQISLDAAAAPARALAGIGKEVSNIGNQLMDWKVRMNEVENAKRESQKKNEWANVYADAQNEMMQMAPEDRRTYWPEKLRELQATIEDESLSQVSRDRLEVAWNNFSAKTSIEVERDASLQIINDTKRLLSVEADREFLNGNSDGARAIYESNRDIFGDGVVEQKLFEFEKQQQTNEWMSEIKNDAEGFIRRLDAGEINPDFNTQNKLRRMANFEIAQDIKQKTDAYNTWLLDQDNKGVVVSGQDKADMAAKLGLPAKTQLLIRDAAKKEFSEEDYAKFEKDLVSLTEQMFSGEFYSGSAQEVAAKLSEWSVLVDAMPEGKKRYFKELKKILDDENQTETKRLILGGGDVIKIAADMGMVFDLPSEDASEEEKINSESRIELAQSFLTVEYNQTVRRLIESGNNLEGVEPLFIINEMMKDRPTRKRLEKAGIKIGRIKSDLQDIYGGLLPMKKQIRVSEKKEQSQEEQPQEAQESKVGDVIYGKK